MSSPPARHQAPPLGTDRAVLAFDVGGTDTKAALVDDLGNIRDIVRIPTPLDGKRAADAVVTRIGELAQELLRNHPDVHPQAAGLAVPGHVDEKRGVGVFSKNLGWSNYPFRDRAETTLGLPVSFNQSRFRKKKRLPVTATQRRLAARWPVTRVEEGSSCGYAWTSHQRHLSALTYQLLARDRADER